jgi:hypothetical protein
MFQRIGYVRVGLRKDHSDFQANQERLIDRALSSTAEDFEEVESSDGICEMEVRVLVEHPNPLNALMGKYSSFAHQIFWPD